MVPGPAARPSQGRTPARGHGGPDAKELEFENAECSRSRDLGDVHPARRGRSRGRGGTSEAPREASGRARTRSAAGPSRGPEGRRDRRRRPRGATEVAPRGSRGLRVEVCLAPGTTGMTWTRQANTRTQEGRPRTEGPKRPRATRGPRRPTGEGAPKDGNEERRTPKRGTRGRGPEGRGPEARTTGPKRAEEASGSSRTRSAGGARQARAPVGPGGGESGAK